MADCVACSCAKLVLLPPPVVWILVAIFSILSIATIFLPELVSLYDTAVHVVATYINILRISQEGKYKQERDGRVVRFVRCKIVLNGCIAIHSVKNQRKVY